MVAPHFENPGYESEPAVPETASRFAAEPSLAESFRTDPESYLWVKVPEAAPELPESPPLESRERASEQRKRRDLARREELLAELCEASDPPPPPIGPTEDDRGGRSGDQRRQNEFADDSRAIEGIETFRTCEACRGSGKKWLVLKCPRCGGLGSVRVK